MNHKLNLALLAGLNIVASAVGVGSPGGSAVTAEPNPSQESLQVSSQSGEASFLKVSATCKVSHAAFDAVSVALENVSTEIISIHAEIEDA